MSIKDIEFWMNLSDKLKDVWFFILIPVVISIIKLLNKNDLYQTRNVEKNKADIKKYVALYLDDYCSIDIFGFDDIILIEWLS